MNPGIRARLSFAFTAVFAVLLAVFSGVVYALLSMNLERNLARDTERAVDVLIADLKEDPVDPGEGWDAEIAELDEESGEFQLVINILDRQGRALFLTSGSTWTATAADVAGVGETPARSLVEIGGEPYLAVTRTLTSPTGEPLVIRVARSRTEVDRVRHDFLVSVAAGIPVVLLAAVIAGGLLSRRALAPVESIRRRADAIGSDNLDARLSYAGPPDELARLTHTLNGLLGRVQAAIGQLKRFVADASHELRVPLAGLRGTLEVALRQDRSKEELRQVVEKAHAESERISELVANLLSLASFDARQMKLEKTRVGIGSFLERVLEDAAPIAIAAGISLDNAPFPEGEAVFDEAAVHGLLMNLIENAVKYNVPHGRVTVSAALTAEAVKVFVRDTGIGIAPEDQARIFERFFRVDKARSRETGGTGLGLSIARAIAEAHGGSITVSSAPGAGSEFTLILKRL